MNIQRSGDSNTFEVNTGSGGGANIGISRDDRYRRSYDSDSSMERVSLKPNLTNEDMGRNSHSRNVPNLVDSHKSHTGIDLLVNPKRRITRDGNDTPRSHSPYASHNDEYHSDHKVKSDSDDGYYKNDSYNKNDTFNDNNDNNDNKDNYDSVHVDKSDHDDD